MWQTHWHQVVSADGFVERHKRWLLRSINMTENILTHITFPKHWTLKATKQKEKQIQDRLIISWCKLSPWKHFHLSPDVSSLPHLQIPVAFRHLIITINQVQAQDEMMSIVRSSQEEITCGVVVRPHVLVTHSRKQAIPAIIETERSLYYHVRVTEKPYADCADRYFVWFRNVIKL